MNKSGQSYVNNEDRYLVLESGAYLKQLEGPAVYKTTDDSLYEVDSKTFDFLQKCDGSLRVCELNPPKDFLHYILDENLASLSEIPRAKEIKVAVNMKPSLRYLLVEITSRCNLACKHCYQGEAKAVDLDFETFSNLTYEFEDIGGLRLIISGGEPVLHPRFKEINQLMKDRAFRSILLTNGTLLDANFIADIGFNEIQISLDGLGKGHDYLRGEGTFKKTLAALKLLKKRDIQLSIASMVHAQNYDEFSDLENLVKDLGAISWSIDVPSETGRLAAHAEILPPLEKIKSILQLQFGAEIHDSESDLICGANLGCVKSSGQFTKCGFYTKWSGGHISEGLRKCWFNLPRMRFSELNCKCKFLKECRGGCRYRAECYNGSKDADPIKCLLYGIQHAP